MVLSFFRKMYFKCKKVPKNTKKFAKKGKKYLVFQANKNFFCGGEGLTRRPFGAIMDKVIII